VIRWFQKVLKELREAPQKWPVGNPDDLKRDEIKRKTKDIW
jgi:hypothetical protein